MPFAKSDVAVAAQCSILIYSTNNALANSYKSNERLHSTPAPAMVLAYILAGALVFGLLGSYVERAWERSQAPFNRATRFYESILEQAGQQGDWRSIQHANLHLLWLATVKRHIDDDINASGSQRYARRREALIQTRFHQLEIPYDLTHTSVVHVEYVSRILSESRQNIHQARQYAYKGCRYYPEAVLTYPRDAVLRARKARHEWAQNAMPFLAEDHLNETVIKVAERQWLPVDSRYLPSNPQENSLLGHQWEQMIMRGDNDFEGVWCTHEVTKRMRHD